MGRGKWVGWGWRFIEFEWDQEGGGVGWGGRLFEAGRLLTFFAFRMGAYSRWALIRGWVLIRINTVFACSKRPDHSRQVIPFEIHFF